MEFEVIEIKALGPPTRAAGFTKAPESLSLRLEGKDPESYSSSRVFTIHAVVPYSPEFATVQVGQKFKFERVEESIQRMSPAGRRQFLEEHGIKVKTGERV